MIHEAICVSPQLPNAVKVNIQNVFSSKQYFTTLEIIERLQRGVHTIKADKQPTTIFSDS
jgi:hypothetical protein